MDKYEYLIELGKSVPKISEENKKEENIIKKYSKKIPILKAGNMSLGINLLMYLTEIASKSLNNSFLSKISVSYTHLRAHETPEHLVCRLLLEKKKQS